MAVDVVGNVSCGPPLDGFEVTVRPPGSSELLPEGQEGEVVVRGTSVVDMIAFTEDPVSIQWDPTTRRLVVGFLVGQTTRLQALCPYVPAS